jgi:hypothetical protein
VAANFLLALGYCSGERRFELRPLPIVEHHGEHVERELRSVFRQVLRLRRATSELELSAALHRFEIELLVLVALALRRRESSLEIVEALDDFCDVDHEIFMIEAGSTVNAKRSQ